MAAAHFKDLCPSVICLHKQHQTPPIWSISLHHQQKPTLMACFAASTVAAHEHQRKCKRAAPTDLKCIFSTSIALCTSSHARHQ
eukprot:scaffold581_cov127-Skeletonema_marinoi.AAC.12